MLLLTSLEQVRPGGEMSCLALSQVTCSCGSGTKWLLTSCLLEERLSFGFGESFVCLCIVVLVEQNS